MTETTTFATRTNTVAGTCSHEETVLDETARRRSLHVYVTNTGTLQVAIGVAASGGGHLVTTSTPLALDAITGYVSIVPASGSGAVDYMIVEGIR